MGLRSKGSRPPFASHPHRQTTGSRQRWPKASVYRTPAAESRAVIDGPRSVGREARYAVIRDPSGAVAALYQSLA
jgi:hypothetical protein